MTKVQFAQRIKQQYPQYKSVDDAALADRMIAKYPQYNDLIDAGTPEKEINYLNRTVSVLGAIFGGDKIGDAIGTQIARVSPAGRELADQERKGVAPAGSVESTFSTPSAGQLVGDTFRAAALATPIGRIGGLVARGAGTIGLARGARVAGNIVEGGLTGVLADAGAAMSEGQKPKLGLGTALGIGIPAASPVAQAIGRASTRLAGKVGAEVQGALTGTSAETIEQAFEAAKRGGKGLEKFTAAMRGEITPEAIVENVRGNIDRVAAQRQTLFRDTLADLSDATVSTAPAKQQFLDELSSANITVDDDGLLDFSASKLRTVPNAQSKLQQAWKEINDMPEELAIGELDTTRQAIKGIKAISGDEPSANLANMLIDDAVRSVRKAGEQVDGYGQMLDNFGETSQFLDELGRGLSTGDKRTVDQAYRRMATALKTNNEQRMALVRDLDEMTDGSILSTIAGQQLSETLPRGIFRQIAAGIAGGAILTGGLSSQLIPALVFASPRVTGEVVRALGLGAAKADQIIEALQTARGLLTKIGVIGGAIQGRSDLEQ